MVLASNRLPGRGCSGRPPSNHTGLNTEVQGAEVPVSHTVMSSGVTWATIDPADWELRIGPNPACAQTVIPVTPLAGEKSAPTSP